MAQQQKNTGIRAPGFAGLNTEDSPLAMDPSFASLAANCVIDRFGRVGSRRGLQAYTTNPAVLEGKPVVVIEEFATEDGTTYLFACGNNKIFIQQTVDPFELVELSYPAGYSINDNNWKIVPFNEKCYFVQKEHRPLVFDPSVSATSLSFWAEEPSTVGVDGYPNVAHAAFGRLWLSGFDNNGTVLYWSSLLNGEDWSAGGTGSLFTAEYWPSGFDTVTAVAAHNNFLVVFGTRNILMYSTTADVTNTITLEDTIEGIGCLARDSVIGTGKDFLFVDATGVRSLNRTVQEKSVPIGDLSRNVRTDFQTAIAFEENDINIRGVYHTEDSFYCVFFPTSPLTYVFDTRQQLQNGASRTTTWGGFILYCGVRLRNRETLFGGVGGLYQYSGAEDVVLDDTGNSVKSAIDMEYATHPLDFGSSVNLVFPKQVDVILIGGQAGSLDLRWSYDYTEFPTGTNRIAKTINIANAPAFWNIDEWNTTANYAPVLNQINYLNYNIWGNGRNIKLGLSLRVLGSPISVQEINVQALQGRII